MAARKHRKTEGQETPAQALARLSRMLRWRRFYYDAHQKPEFGYVLALWNTEHKFRAYVRTHFDELRRLGAATLIGDRNDVLIDPIEFAKHVEGIAAQVLARESA